MKERSNQQKKLLTKKRSTKKIEGKKLNPMNHLVGDN